MFTLGCEEKHEYCFDCLRDHLNVNLGEGNIPMCPTPKCGHVFTEREVLFICGRDSPLPNKFSRILLREGLMSIENCVGCPTPGFVFIFYFFLFSFFYYLYLYFILFYFYFFYFIFYLVFLYNFSLFFILFQFFLLVINLLLF